MSGGSNRLEAAITGDLFAHFGLAPVVATPTLAPLPAPTPASPCERCGWHQRRGSGDPCPICGAPDPSAAPSEPGEPQR